MTNAIITMQLIIVTNGVACRRTPLEKQATQSVFKSWHRILILFKIFVLPGAIAGGGTDERYWCGYRRTLQADDKGVGVARRRHRLEEKRNSLCFASSYASDD
ncbi:hypothetical protein LC608_24945 [Nostoc sp. XA010]|uniref:hypothetical protein n=1 Tax=Nostoc sp. XA010 TaxID=2780407 RepID=UPI001E2E5D9B|nr:hypothetical protein [Nostoc sp. XA010]MCC5660165.1 hypothetical protein [Nostoc sp. XA010]